MASRRHVARRNDGSSKLKCSEFNVIYELYLNCIVLIVLVLISFSHGYSAILAAKLMIKCDLTWDHDSAAHRPTGTWQALKHQQVREGQRCNQTVGRAKASLLKPRPRPKKLRLERCPYEECGVSPQPIPEFPLRHSSKFNKIKIHTHTLYLSTDFLYFIFIHFIFIKLHF